MVPHKSPAIFQHLWPGLLWRMPSEGKKIYLTFDDGPIPGLTDWVLQTLNQFDAKATFFCVGENVEKHPDIFQNILAAGHSIGNHTYNHLNGWQVSTTDYLENIEKCDHIFEKYNVKTDFFRPPYGRLKPRQRRQLKNRKVVMWDVLSKDYDKALQPETILPKCIQASSAGTIIVFHDNEKALRNLKEVLPNYLKFFKDQGFQFDSL